MYRSRSTLCLLLSVLIIVPSSILHEEDHGSRIESSTDETKSFGLDPDENLLTGFFTENGGQWDESVKFAGSTNFGKILIMDDGICFQVDERTDSGIESTHHPDVVDLPIINRHYIRYTFEGNRVYTMTGIDELPHRSNYFIGSDETRWATGLRNYETVVLDNVWGGIDLRYSFTSGNPKYEFILSPGSDVDDIEISVQGIKNMAVHTDSISFDIGNDIRFTDGGLMTFYSDDMNAVVTSSMTRIDKDTFGFDVDDHDEDRTLIIDPIIYTTYIGAEGYEYSGGLERDEEGCFYIGCQTNSVGFPTTTGSFMPVSPGGSWDIAILKMNETANGLVYSTYIGGNQEDSCPHIDIDSEGNVCFLGYTNSNDTPTTANAYDRSYNGDADHFVGKLSKDGDDLIFSTYLGSDGMEWTPRGIGLDSDGNVYVTGDVGSGSFPTTIGAYDRTMNGNSDAYLAKLSGNGSALIYSTFIGGGSDEKSGKLQVMDDGTVILGGNTESSDFPTTSGAYNRIASGNGDSWVLRMNSGGTGLVFSTLLGGSGDDALTVHCLDDENNILISGWVNSNDFPTTEDAYDDTYNGGGMYGDPVVVKLRSDGSDLIFSTYLGGYNQEIVNDAFMDHKGRIFLCGWTQSSNFPLTKTAFDTIISDGEGFISILDKNGENLLYSSFVGGNRYDRFDHIDLDDSGDIILLGCSQSNDLPTTLESYDDSHNGGYDMVLMKISIEEIKTGLSPPSNFQVELTKEGNVLKWYPPEDWETCGIIGYNIYRRTYWTSNEFITFVDETSYLDSDITLGQVFFYSVTSVNNSGESPYSRELIGFDYKEPIIVNDLSDDIGHPNEMFNISAVITDNIGILTANINLWYNAYNYHQYTLAHGENDVWFVNVPLRPLIGNISYQFSVCDYYYNRNISDIIVKPLIDHLAPNITSLDYESESTTGETFWIHFAVSDDIAVNSIGLDYWFGEDEDGKEHLIWERVYEANARIQIPENMSDQLNFQLIMIDSSFNMNITEVFSLNITDNDPPQLDNGIIGLPAYLYCGSNISVPIPIRENIGIKNVSLEYWYGDDEITFEEIIPENGTYYLVISPPRCRMDTFHFTINITDVNWNSAIFGPYHILVVDNLCPCVSPIQNITVEQGQYFCIEANASDNIGIRHFSWEGCPIEGYDQYLEGSISSPGTYNITVTAYDWMMNSNSTTFSILVKTKELDRDDEEKINIEGYLTMGLGIAAFILVLVILTILTRTLLVRRKMRKIWEGESEEPKEESDQTIDTVSTPDR